MVPTLRRDATRVGKLPNIVFGHVLKLLRSSNNITTRLFNSSKFTTIIIFLFVIQAAWVAISYNFSPIDEEFHFGIIKTYTDHLWPVIYNQPLSYDAFRDFAGEGSKLFHFILSFPLRLIELMTPDVILQVKILRLFNIAFVAAGLWLYARLFDVLNVNRALINITYIILTSLPITLWVAGSINYDNFLFLLTALFLFVAVKLYRTKEIKYPHLVALIGIGMAASLVKFTFLPIFILGTLWVVLSKRKTLVNRNFFIQRVDDRNRKEYLHSIRDLVVATAFLIPLLFLFSQTYIVNFINYGTPRPECQKTLGVERCLANSVIRTNEGQLATKHERPRDSPGAYFFVWINKMFYSTSNLWGYSHQSQPMPIYFTSLVIVILSILFAGIYFMRGADMATEMKVLLFIGITFLAIVFVNNFLLYDKYYVVRAVTFRYIIIVVPIILIPMLFVSQRFYKKYKILATPLAIVGLFILSQGGGVVSHVLSTDDSWHWEGSRTIEVKDYMKEKISPFVKEPIFSE